MTLVAYLALVVASAALLCGHQAVTPPLPQRGAWRGRTAPHRGARGTRAATTPSRPAQSRTAVRPRWAATQPLTYEETT